MTIAYLDKTYQVGVNRKQYKGDMSTKFYYDRQHDTVFEKDEISMRQIVCFIYRFTLSLYSNGDILVCFLKKRHIYDESSKFSCAAIHFIERSVQVR